MRIKLDDCDQMAKPMYALYSVRQNMVSSDNISWQNY